MEDVENEIIKFWEKKKASKIDRCEVPNFKGPNLKVAKIRVAITLSSSGYRVSISEQFLRLKIRSG